jgi:hypothetical protein
MDIASYLRSHRIGLSDILAKVDESVALQPDEVLFAAGSIVEGLGDTKSDLDLFLLTSRSDIALSSLNCLALLVGDCLIDIRVLLHAELDALLHRFAGWAAQPRQPRHALGFTYEERKVLHRLWSGMALHGEDRFTALRQRLKGENLARHKLDCARFMASTFQIDLAGLYGAGDALSMPFVAQELLGHTADALLARYGLTNPNPKWRVRQLGNVPEAWRGELPGRPPELSAVRTFAQLHRAPEDESLDGAFAHAARIVAFSRAIFPSVECKLLGPPGTMVPQLPVAPCGAAAEAVLPVLDFDVQVSYQDGRFELWRLNDPAVAFALSPLAYSLLCLCDGRTSRMAALEQAARQAGPELAQGTVDELLRVIRYGRLEVAGPIDEDALGVILRSAAS